jgi:uncharacterized membrane protein YbhN (UPF0104 family)
VLFRHFSDFIHRRIRAAFFFLPARARGKTEDVLQAFIQGVESTKDDVVMVTVFAYTLLEWAVIAAAYFCLTSACPGLEGLRAADALILLGFVSFGAVVQVPGVGGGAQLVAIIVLTELYGIPLAVASSVAVVLWFITFIVIVPIGLLMAFRAGLNWRKIKALEERSVT